MSKISDLTEPLLNKSSYAASFFEKDKPDVEEADELVTCLGNEKNHAQINFTKMY